MRTTASTSSAVGVAATAAKLAVDSPRALLSAGNRLISARGPAKRMAQAAIPSFATGFVPRQLESTQRAQATAGIVLAAPVPAGMREKASQFLLTQVMDTVRADPGRPYSNREVIAYTEERAMPVLERLPSAVPMNWRVRVVNSPVAHAEALPNGMVIITTQMLRILNSGASVSALAGHEGAHSALDHSIVSVLTGLGLLTAAPLLAPLSYPLLMAMARQQELQADVLGVRASHDAGNSARGALETIEALDWEAALTSPKKAPPNLSERLLATHPSFGDRWSELNQLIKAEGWTGGYRGIGKHREIQELLSAP